MEQIFGTMTLVHAVLMALIALPSQILKQYKEKKSGLGWLMTILPLGVYVSRTCYAVPISSWYILIPDSLGLMFLLVLLVQKIKYTEK